MKNKVFLNRFFILTLIFAVLCALAGCQLNDTGEPAQPAEDQQYPQIFTPVFAEDIDFALFSEGVFCIFGDGKYGFMNEAGVEITSYIYDYAYPFSEGLACVYRDEKYGFIDKDGNEALPAIYDKANSFVEGLAYFEIGDKYGFMDKSGSPVFLLDCDSVSSFSQGLAYFSLDGKYGYIDKTGEIAIAPVYDDVDYFKDGLAKMRLGGKFGIIDMAGKQIVPAEYDTVAVNGGFIEVTLNEKYGCYNTAGERILPCEYEYIYMDNNSIIFNSNGKRGLADAKGNIVIEPVYDSIRILQDGGSDKALKTVDLVEVKIDGRCVIIDFAGNIKVPAKYDWIDCVSDGMIRVSLDDKTGFLNTSDFSESIPLIYDCTWGVFEEGQAVVSLDGKYGVIDKSGNTVVPFEYENISRFENGAFLFKQDGKCKLVDRDGQVISDGQYDDISECGDCYRVEIDDNDGVINAQGEEIVPPVYGYFFNYVYNARNYYVTSKYDGSGMPVSIIKTGADHDVDLSAVLLKNEITPKIKLFSQHLKFGSWNGIPAGMESSEMEMAFNELDSFIKVFKLYDINGERILYFYAEPFFRLNFPMSYSGFYAINGSQVDELITGNECGGSLRGDYVCLWKDKQTSKITIGTAGATGGFAGFSVYGSVYDYKNVKLDKIFSYHYVEYSQTDSDEGYVVEHWINDEKTTEGEYVRAMTRFELIY